MFKHLKILELSDLMSKLICSNLLLTAVVFTMDFENSSQVTLHNENGDCEDAHVENFY